MQQLDQFAHRLAHGLGITATDVAAELEVAFWQIYVGTLPQVS
jgi:hypothetical protein